MKIQWRSEFFLIGLKSKFFVILYAYFFNKVLKFFRHLKSIFYIEFPIFLILLLTKLLFHCLNKSKNTHGFERTFCNILSIQIVIL